MEKSTSDERNATFHQTADEMRFERLLRLAAALQAGQSDSAAEAEVAQAGSSPMTADSDLLRREVARRAYEIFLQRGGKHGLDMDDWLQAEAEMRVRWGAERDKAVMRLALAWGVPNIASDGLAASR